MDINCISNCEYQNDGKCTLNEIPVTNNATLKSSFGRDSIESTHHAFYARTATAENDSGCPYFIKKGHETDKYQTNPYFY